VACTSWAYKQDYRFPRRLKRIGYIRCDTTVSVLIDFSGCIIFCILCLPKQFVYHLLPPVQKCNNLRDHGHPYKLPDLWPPYSPDLNPINYKIWVTIQQRVHSTNVQDVKDLVQRLIDAWAGVEESVIQNVIDQRRRHLHTAFSHRRILWIFSETKISMIVKIKLQFIVKWDISFSYR